MVKFPFFKILKNSSMLFFSVLTPDEWPFFNFKFNFNVKINFKI